MDNTITKKVCQGLCLCKKDINLHKGSFVKGEDYYYEIHVYGNIGFYAVTDSWDIETTIDEKTFNRCFKVLTER